jgi:hypothetical protein
MKTVAIPLWMRIPKAAFSFAAIIASFQTQAITLDTTPYWNGASPITPWGHPNTATYGQTFIAPASQLDSFTFYLGGGHAASLQFKAVVFGWEGPLRGSGGGATGEPLFISSSLSYAASSSFQAITINTGGTMLTPGYQYVMALTISDPTDYAKSSKTTTWGALLNIHAPDSASGGGGFVFFNNGNNFAALTTNTWDTFSDFGDLVFKAEFSNGPAVPDGGATIVMIGSAVTGLVSLRRKLKG